MQPNNLHMQLATAYPNLEEITVGKGKGLTLFGDIHTDNGVKRAFLKILGFEGIAREVFCAVLARKLHLPVRPAYYVDMSNTRYHQYGNLESLAFGSLYDLTPARRLNQIMEFEAELLKWTDLLPSAVFDEWIANGDRIPNNMVFERGGVFWLYDHDEAFPGYIGESTPSNSQLLMLAAREKSEFELVRIREQAMKIIQEYELLDWQEIYELILAKDFPYLRIYFEKYIRFLQNRTPEMRKILTLVLGIKQNEFTFDARRKNLKNQNYDN
jgi:hypothetical protein